MKILCTILLFLTSTFVIAQQQFKLDNKPYYQNVIYLVFQPNDLGLGLEYDHHFNNFGLYSALTYGNYRHYHHIFIKDHYKFSLGYLLYLPRTSETTTFYTVSCGITYNKYGRVDYNLGYVSKETLRALSLELGIGAEMKRFNSTIHFDFFKHEGSMLFGYAFIRNKHLKTYEDF